MPGKLGPTDLYGTRYTPDSVCAGADVGGLPIYANCYQQPSANGIPSHQPQWLQSLGMNTPIRPKSIQSGAERTVPLGTGWPTNSVASVPRSQIYRASTPFSHLDFGPFDADYHLNENPYRAADRPSSFRAWSDTGSGFDSQRTGRAGVCKDAEYANMVRGTTRRGHGVYSDGYTGHERRPASRTAQSESQNMSSAIIIEQLAGIKDKLNRQEAALKALSQASSRQSVQNVYDTQQFGAYTPGTETGIDAQFVRRCILNASLTANDRNKALGILSAFAKKSAVVATNSDVNALPSANIYSLPSIATAMANVRDGQALTHLDMQTMGMAKDITKMKAYNKFQRQQQDSDRLARIEAQLTSRADDHRVRSALDRAARHVEKLNDRVSKLEEFSRDGKPRTDLQDQVRAVSNQVQELNNYISNRPGPHVENVERLYRKITSLTSRLDDMKISSKSQDTYAEEVNRAYMDWLQNAEKARGWSGSNQVLAGDGADLHESAPTHRWPCTGEWCEGCGSGPESSVRGQDNNSNGGWKGDVPARANSAWGGSPAADWDRNAWCHASDSNIDEREINNNTNGIWVSVASLDADDTWDALTRDAGSNAGRRSAGSWSHVSRGHYKRSRRSDNYQERNNNVDRVWMHPYARSYASSEHDRGSGHKEQNAW